MTASPCDKERSLTPTWSKLAYEAHPAFGVGGWEEAPRRKNWALEAQGMLCQPVRRQGRVRGRTFWMLPSTVEGRDGAPTRGVVRAPSSMSLRSMLARIASRGAARSSHVAWMRALVASKRLGDAISWRGRSSARELTADSLARIAGSCRRQSSMSASASDSAARAARSWQHLSSA